MSSRHVVLHFFTRGSGSIILGSWVAIGPRDLTIISSWVLITTFIKTSSSSDIMNNTTSQLLDFGTQGRRVWPLSSSSRTAQTPNWEIRQVLRPAVKPYRYLGTAPGHFIPPVPREQDLVVPTNPWTGIANRRREGDGVLVPSDLCPPRVETLLREPPNEYFLSPPSV